MVLGGHGDQMVPVISAAAVGGTPLTKLVGRNAAGPNFDGLVDGWRLDAAGYKLSDFMLKAPDAATPDRPWHLKLGLRRMPKPVLLQ